MSNVCWVCECELEVDDRVMMCLECQTSVHIDCMDDDCRVSKECPECGAIMMAGEVVRAID